MNTTYDLPRGGQLLITCPHFYPLHDEPYDFWRPTHHALRFFGNKFGLDILHQVKAGDAWDVLGTLLPNCYPQPVNRSLGNRILNKIVSRCHNFLFQLLVSRRLQTSVQLRGPLYMSNIALKND